MLEIICKMRVLKLLVAYLIISINCYSQSSTDTIYSFSENFKWIEKLKSLTENYDKLNLIVQKIKTNRLCINDSLKGNSENDIRWLLENKKCRIIFSLQIRKKYYLHDINKSPKFDKLLKYLNSYFIDSITIIHGPAGAALYGPIGACGAIELISNSKLLKRKLRNL